MGVDGIVIVQLGVAASKQQSRVIDRSHSSRQWQVAAFAVRRDRARMVTVSTRWRRRRRATVIAIAQAAPRTACSRPWPRLGLAAFAVIVPEAAGSRTDYPSASAPEVAAWSATLGTDDLPAATPEVDPTLGSATGVGEGETAGIEVTIATPGQARAGTRTPIDVAIRNTSTETFYWQAGGCGLAAEVSAGPVGGLMVGFSGRVSADRIWDGDPASLSAAVTASETGRGMELAQPESATGWVSMGCTADSKMEAFAPGDELSYSGSAEIRVPPGSLPEGGVYEAAATFVPYRAPDGYPHQPLDPIETRVRFTVVEDPARGADPVDDVLAAILADGRLTAWLSTTVIPDRLDLVQAYRVGMTWWRDAWELWIEPKWISGMLRIRVDPANEVIDVRIHHSNGPPADEPDAATVPGTPPDEILLPISTWTTRLDP